MVSFSNWTRPLIAFGIVAVAAAAQAQTTAAQTSNQSYDANRTSLLPYTHSGYLGLNVGRAHFDTNCGALNLRCDNSATSGHVYLGGYFNPYLGAEIGYMDMGSIERGGGSTDAQGLNLSLVGKVPLSQQFSIYGKLGTTYGRTRTSAAAGMGLVPGKESGWGPSYALGLSWNFDSNWSAVLEWDRNRFQFSGNNDRYIHSTSLGLKYSF
ncbi:MAG: outer membrane beta-barrel protein [Burkholderiaceae bacterium]